MPRGPEARRPLAVLAALCFSRFCMGLQMQLIASLTPFLIAELGFSYTDIGLLIGLYLAPGVLLALPGSLLCVRFGYRQVGLVGLLLMTAGTLALVFVESFWWAAGARLLGGTGGILMNVAFLRLSTELFEGKAYNRAIAAVMSSWTVGIGLAAVTIPALATSGDWRLPFWLVSGLTFAAALAVWVLVREAPRERGLPGSLWSLGIDPRSRNISLLLGSAFACFTAGGIVFLSFAPPVLTAAGMSLTQASAIASLIIWGSLLGTPLGGWLADRGGARRVIYLGALGSALLVVLVLIGPVPLVLTGLLGLLWGLPAAPFTGLLQRLLPAQALGSGYGLYFTLFYSGFFALPALAGWLVDLTASTAAALWFAALLLAVTALLYWGAARLSRTALARVSR
ncbi:MAG: hypothetical protein Kilf2KO_05310 [Rhodospirillales bacterium]